MKCPNCSSINLDARSELIYVNNISFPIENGKIIPIKRFHLKHPKLDERRYYVACRDCEFQTNNLNNYNESDFSDEEEQSIIDQINCFIDYEPKKRKINLDKKYKKYFESNPTVDEITNYIKNNVNNVNFNLVTFSKHFGEYVDNQVE